MNCQEFEFADHGAFDAIATSEATVTPWTDSNSMGTVKKKRGRLDLFKCDRCRNDKQKCIPEQRVWPIKCNRCKDKGFPCSESRKAQRKSTRVAEFDCRSRFEAELENWFLRYSYRNLIGSAQAELQTLRRNALKPFQDKYTEDFKDKKDYDHDGFRRWVKFSNSLSDFVCARPEPTTEDALWPSLITYMLDNMMIQDLASPIYKSGCALCNPSRQPEYHQILSRPVNIGSEFLLRQWCLNEHFRHASQWESIAQPRVDQEISRLESLRLQVLEKLNTEVLASFGLSPPFVEVHHPPMVALAFFRRGKGHIDCLGRTPLLQWLDFITEEPVLETRALLEGLETVDQQDILGRSLLHVACQKKWVELVALLLRLGADAYLTTIYGHSPLHYAVASGSSEICKMLIRCCVAPQKECLDYYGNSVLYYAVRSRDEAILQAVLSSDCHKCPDVKNDQVCPPPLLRAVFDNNVEFAEALVSKGAKWDICFRQKTIQAYIISMYYNATLSPSRVRWWGLSRRLLSLVSINKESNETATILQPLVYSDSDLCSRAGSVG